MDQAVEICAQSMATDTPRLLTIDAIQWAGFDMTVSAAKETLATARITPNDVQVVELHDCSSANELLTYDALGLTVPDKAHTTRVITYMAVNMLSTLGRFDLQRPSSWCHWLGSVHSFRERAGDRQVPNCKYALQHNVGLGGAVVVGIYKKANGNATQPHVGYRPAIEAHLITQEHYNKACSKPKNRAG
ncbi:hypothetical protein BDB00DRAFT_782955 [Zychaea mexicana]|uniref:uncharacterized protein n=1 Tax=Zychaea mexicana TaxID=64656 RepID=UPI0022FEF795|nr:uncharacterized protein BDB00DRAFT_782955 [Zychaea mexicana]KAI9499440.1 hypothetical protein BDB00DRAFT_782955 [Zychaea mexicana]